MRTQYIFGASLILMLSQSSPALAQTTNSPPMKSRAEIIADAKIYTSDPKWANSDNSTNWAIKKKYCKEGNFFKMGFNRALNGRKRERGLEKITKKCSKAGVVVDETAYFAGWDKGSLSYCTFSQGLSNGRISNNSEAGICGPKNFLQYHKGWEIGNEQYYVLSRHTRHKEEAAEWKAKIVTLENDIEYGTTEAGVTKDKLETLGRWKNALKSQRKEMLTLEQNNPDTFDRSQLIADNKLPWASNWRE